MRSSSPFPAVRNFSARLAFVSLALTGTALSQQPPTGGTFTATAAARHDTSPPLRDLAGEARFDGGDCGWPEMSAPLPATTDDGTDAVVQDWLAPVAMPAPILTFDGIPFASSYCSCAPPDPGGEAGATQYVQVVNEALQVFDKATGASLLGPAALASLWSGFGGYCESNSLGQPIGLYDQLAGRWLVAHIAGPDYTAYT